MLFILKVTTNKEDQVMDWIADRAKQLESSVLSVVRPHGLRGYVILEATSRKNAEEIFKNLPYVKGILKKEVTFEEIKHMIEVKVQTVNIEKGDIVEIIGGTFKRDKAKVIRINKAKEEVVVELLEAAVPIPLTLKIDDVKDIRREG
ncbi:MAG: transcription elongation factor Spt5, partial [Nanoarchaeota archaeon]